MRIIPWNFRENNHNLNNHPCRICFFRTAVSVRTCRVDENNTSTPSGPCSSPFLPFLPSPLFFLLCVVSLRFIIPHTIQYSLVIIDPQSPIAATAFSLSFPLAFNSTSAFSFYLFFSFPFFSFQVTLRSSFCFNMLLFCIILGCICRSKEEKHKISGCGVSLPRAPTLIRRSSDVATELKNSIQVREHFTARKHLHNRFRSLINHLSVGLSPNDRKHQDELFLLPLSCFFLHCRLLLFPSHSVTMNTEK